MDLNRIQQSCELASTMSEIPEPEYKRVSVYYLEKYKTHQHSLIFITAWLIGYYEAEQKAMKNSIDIPTDKQIDRL